MSGLYIPESHLHKSDLQQRINMAIMFGWDKLPEFTNPNIHDLSTLFHIGADPKEFRKIKT